VYFGAYAPGWYGPPAYAYPYPYAYPPPAGFGVSTPNFSFWYGQ
jgi:hypothetical protein